MNKLVTLMLSCMLLLSSTPLSAKLLQIVKLTPENALVLRDRVTDETVSKIITKLMTMPAKNVVLYISSPGGSITAGYALINAIQASGKNVICVADYAISMAFSIFQACNIRYANPHAILMQHQASYSVQGNMTEIRTQVEFTERMVAKLNANDANRIGMPLETFQAKIANEWWLYDDEILAAKAADKQVLVQCSPELIAMREIEIQKSFFGSMTLEWSGCPLIIYPVAINKDVNKSVPLRDFEIWAASLTVDYNWKARLNKGQ
jgi:ATP-dependent Clp protease, protease subunit